VKNSSRGVAQLSATCNECNISAPERSKRSSERTVVQGAGKVVAIRLHMPERWKRERYRLHVEAAV